MPSNGMLRLPPHRRPAPTRTRLRTRRVPLVGYVLTLLLVPVAVLFAAQASGWWITNGHTLPSTALGGQAFGVDGRPAPGGPADPGPGGLASGVTPAASGHAGDSPAAPVTLLDPQDVKGSMAVQQVLDAFPQVTATEIYQLFGVPAGTPASTQLKALVKDGNGYEVTEFREWLRERLATTGS